MKVFANSTSDTASEKSLDVRLGNPPGVYDITPTTRTQAAGVAVGLGGLVVVSAGAGYIAGVPLLGVVLGLVAAALTVLAALMI